MVKYVKQLRLLLSLFLVGSLVACGGAGTDGGGREPPTISISADSESVEAGTEVALTAAIGGQGAAPEGVSWSATGGTFSAPTGLEVVWTAPSAPGKYTVTAELTVGSEVKSEQLELVVTAGGGAPDPDPKPDPKPDPDPEPDPLTVTISGTTSAHYAQTLAFTADVQGEGKDEASVRWQADGGVLSADSGTVVNWTAPAAAGAVTLTATVEGEDAADTLEIEVRLCTSGDVNDETDPCMLPNVHQLQAMSEHLAGHFALVGNIDAAVTATWNGDAGFSPIGAVSSGSFSGTLDGRGFAIAGLHVEAPDANYVGLFSQVGASGMLEDVHLLDVLVVGADYVGALAGLNSGEIRNSSSAGLMAGGNYTGGLVGISNGTIENSSSSVLVSGRVDLTALRHIGGLVGGNDVGGIIRKSFTHGSLVTDDDAPPLSSTGGLVGSNLGVIEDSYSDHEVLSAGDYTGGLVGINQSRVNGGGSILRSFTTSDSKVTGIRNTGGLVGVSFGLIEHSYSHSDPVKGENRVGGLVGGLQLPPPGVLYDHSGQVRESYSMSVVQGSGEVGGLVGFADAGTEVATSYWDVQRSGYDTSAGGGVGVGTAQMVHAATFSGWDFVDVWTINEGRDTPDLLANPRPPVE